MFMSYALHCLSWPLVDHRWPGLLLWLPWFALLALRLRDALRPDPARERSAATDFVLATGLWVLLQVAAVSYARSGTGELPASRYGDVFGVGLANSFVALALLATRFPRLRATAPRL